MVDNIKIIDFDRLHQTTITLGYRIVLHLKIIGTHVGIRCEFLTVGSITKVYLQPVYNNIIYSLDTVLSSLTPSFFCRI